jgi:serine/threonine-protein kinase HipA
VKLTVFVNDRPVATLESPDTFRHVLAYHPDVDPADFVSLLMPVRTESYAYPELHPLFRMNLPEGFLLSILQETLGPHVGASPLKLLAVVGRNVIGRVKLATPGADPSQLPVTFDVAEILRGDNSEAAFVDLVRRFATSGVSGVVPKFLSPPTLEPHAKGTLATDRYIVKGTTARLPGVALNEHFCLDVARCANIPAAMSEVSDDGQALLVHRFDVRSDGTRRGMEDLCSLLLLRPEQKYESTWERVINRIREIVRDPAQQAAVLSRVADLLLLTYALRNADCHTKNLALIYDSRDAIELAPVYDLVTTTAYADYRNNPPGMPIEGRSTWYPRKALERFLQVRCNVMPADTRERVERIGQAIVEVAPRVLEAAKQYPHFSEVAATMLRSWNDGLDTLRIQKTWSVPSLDPLLEAADLPRPI